MTPEGSVKAKVKAILRRYKLWYFMPVSAGYGKHGVPDFICCVRGTFLGIECKAKGGSVTHLQAQCHLEIVQAGGYTLVVNPHNVNVVEAYIQMLGASPHEIATK